MESENPSLRFGFNETALRYYPRLQRVERYVRERSLKEIRLKDAADAAGLETKYFSAFFHSRVGVTFRDWIRWLRVERAKELMRREDDGITHIAFSAGFRDVRSLERAFKQFAGVTPVQWRSSVRPN